MRARSGFLHDSNISTSRRSERADVVRGLRTYVLASPANARRFAELYSQLAATRRVLPPDLVREFEAAHASR